jgi:hypothetical protein
MRTGFHAIVRKRSVRFNEPDLGEDRTVPALPVGEELHEVGGNLSAPSVQVEKLMSAPLRVTGFVLKSEQVGLIPVFPQ